MKILQKIKCYFGFHTFSWFAVKWSILKFDLYTIKDCGCNYNLAEPTKVYTLDTYSDIGRAVLMDIARKHK